MSAAAIYTVELEKYTETTLTELNRTYTGGEANNGTSKFQARRFLLLANSKRFSGVWNNLKNITLLGTGNYPKTPTAAYNILFWHKNLTPP